MLLREKIDRILQDFQDAIEGSLVIEQDNRPDDKAEAMREARIAITELMIACEHELNLKEG